MSNELPKDILSERFFSIFPKFVDEIVKFGEKGYFMLKEHMINIIRDILSKTKNSNIMKALSDGLVYMTKFMKEEDKGGCILNIGIQMAQEDDEQKK